MTVNCRGFFRKMFENIWQEMTEMNVLFLKNGNFFFGMFLLLVTSVGICLSVGHHRRLTWPFKVWIPRTLKYEVCGCGKGLLFSPRGKTRKWKSTHGVDTMDKSSFTSILIEVNILLFDSDLGWSSVDICFSLIISVFYILAIQYHIRWGLNDSYW